MLQNKDLVKPDVTHLAKVQTKDGQILIAYWDAEHYCWKNNNGNEIIPAERIVGFTEINYGFPDE